MIDKEAGGMNVPQGRHVKKKTKEDEVEHHPQVRHPTGCGTHFDLQCRTASDVLGGDNPQATFVCPVCGDIFDTSFLLYLFYRHLQDPVHFDFLASHGVMCEFECGQGFIDATHQFLHYNSGVSGEMRKLDPQEAKDFYVSLEGPQNLFLNAKRADFSRLGKALDCTAQLKDIQHAWSLQLYDMQTGFLNKGDVRSTSTTAIRWIAVGGVKERTCLLLVRPRRSVDARPCLYQH
jgi:hypothetical protein